MGQAVQHWDGGAGGVSEVGSSSIFFSLSPCRGEGKDRADAVAWEQIN